MFLLVLLTLSLGVYKTQAQQWISPCPTLFSYDPSGVQGDTWYGDALLKTDQELSGIWMRLVLDRPPIEVGTDFGEVVQRESQEYLIRKPGHKLAPGETLKVRISVKFNPLEPAPQLVGFRLNARVVCPESGILDKTQPIAVPTPPPTPVLESPCPQVFQYEPLNETDKWFGVIQLKSDTPLNGVWIRIILDRESVQLGVSEENWFGEVTTGDNKEYIIKNPQYRLQPGDTVPVRFFIKFLKNKPIPKVVELRVNAKTVCETSILIVPTRQDPVIPSVAPAPSPSLGGSSFPDTSKGTDDDEFFKPDFVPGRKPFLGAIDEVQCGTTVSQPRPLITYGQITSEGEWPWHAALYRTKGIDMKYICGGSLISKNFVITVAHCVSKVNSNSIINPDSLSVLLGKYYLTKYNAGVQYFQADKLIIHPDYDYRTYRNDIALIKLNHQADYTDRVRPICLWSGSVDLRNIIRKEGTVVGWGFDQTGVVTETLYKTNMPVVETETCIYSYPDFFGRFTNEKTFCAGFRNYSSVCNGDSGGGMVFPKDGVPKRWQLRGLVSIGVALQSEAVCDTKHYAVFTDVAKYLDWISRAMLN